MNWSQSLKRRLERDLNKLVVGLLFNVFEYFAYSMAECVLLCRKILNRLVVVCAEWLVPNLTGNATHCFLENIPGSTVSHC